ncbi:hypothetical protein D3C72_1607670 [compost metagenome]
MDFSISNQIPTSPHSASTLGKAFHCQAASGDHSNGRDQSAAPAMIRYVPGGHATFHRGEKRAQHSAISASTHQARRFCGRANPALPWLGSIQSSPPQSQITISSVTILFAG